MAEPNTNWGRLPPRKLSTNARNTTQRPANLRLKAPGFSKTPESTIRSDGRNDTNMRRGTSR